MPHVSSAEAGGGKTGSVTGGNSDADARPPVSRSPFRSPGMRTLFEPGAAAALAARTRNGAGVLSGPGWSVREKPDGMREEWWLRLLEMRDTRIALERDADRAWSGACELAVALEALQV